MIERRTLPSGAFVREITDEGRRVVWSAEVVPRDGSAPARIRVSTPMSFEVSDLIAGQIQEALEELRANRWMLDAVER